MTYDNISSQYQNYRRIALIVVHCSATRADRSFPVEALRRCHVQERGFADIGYHFYITRDGITHVCRPIDHIGAHARCFGSPDKPGGLSIQLCKSEKKEFYIRYSS